ncbi:MAG: diguanylate cyclase [Pseudonocardiales bacterium]|nr:diguanylate cyclase [Pseudonocardiales bacterium]
MLPDRSLNNAAPNGTSSRSRLSQLVGTFVWGLLLIGVLASIAGAFAWRDSRESQQRLQFDRQASGIVAAVDTALLRDADLTTMFRSMVEARTDLTNRDVERWYTSIDGQNRYPGSLGFSYIARVPANDLGAYIETVQRDPIPRGEGFTEQAITPAGPRSEYCLTRYEIVEPNASELTRAGTGVLSRVDWCASPLSTLLSKATLSNQPEVMSLPELIDGVGGLVIAQLNIDPEIIRQSTEPFLAENARNVGIFIPVYRAGETPDTAEARDAAVIGWIGGTFNIGQILDDAARGSGFAVSLIRKDDAGVNIATKVDQGERATMLHTAKLANDALWTVTVAGDPPAGPSPTAEATALMLAGIVVTGLIFMFVRLVTASRSRALAMVDEKTAELQHIASHDSLTGLANRSLMLDRMEQMLTRSRRAGTTVAVLFIDLDHFKKVNDTAGHPAGDELLAGVATRLAATVRAADTVGRLGGDEFVVVAEFERDDVRADALAERIIHALEEPFHLGETQTAHVVGASIGIATGERTVAHELLRDADMALYEAKNAGRNRYVEFERHMRQGMKSPTRIVNAPTVSPKKAVPMAVT